MKLTEGFKEFLCYCFLVGILAFMVLGCTTIELSKQRKTQDELQLDFFKEQIKKRTYYNV